MLKKFFKKRKGNEMESNSKVIPIFFAVDDRYIAFLAVTLKSLIENSSKEN